MNRIRIKSAWLLILIILAGCRSIDGVGQLFVEQSSTDVLSLAEHDVQEGGAGSVVGIGDANAAKYITDSAEDIQIPGAACVPQKEPLAAEVVSVVDGDTIHIELCGERFKVRYIGIDTPEEAREDTSAEFFAAEATRKNRELVEGRLVYLVPDVSDTDQYGRKLFYVFVDNIFVNYELVRQGYARSVTFPPDVACTDTLKEAERQAREEGVGLWAEE